LPWDVGHIRRGETRPRRRVGTKSGVVVQSTVVAVEAVSVAVGASPLPALRYKGTGARVPLRHEDIDIT